MQISYLGHSCFRIRGSDAVVVTDPFDDYIGISMPKTKADVVTVSHEHQDHNCLAKVENDPFVIRAPGEYEVGNISVFGLASFHDSQKGAERGRNTIYNINVDEITVCHLGDLGERLNDTQLEEVNNVDVLLVPVGGVYTIDPKEAVEVINQVEPRIVIPMHYKAPGMDEKIFGKLATVDDFLNEIGASDARKENKLVISKTNLPQEMEVVVLLRRT